MKKRTEFLPFSRPSIGELETNEILECLRSGWITTGPRCLKFEEDFRSLTGAGYAVSVSSATAGMHITLLAMGIGPGTEVITPSLTFASTINILEICGARPVYCDIEYETLNIDALLIEEKITKRTKAIIPVHFAGAPADMGTISEIARKHGLAVIEDAAHASGTRFDKIHAGGFGWPAIFSFHPIKNITTGEGGMITFNDPDLDRRLRLLRFHGIERDAWKRYGKGGNPEYDIHKPGYKYNMTDIQAALGIVQLSRLEEFNGRRRQIAEIYLRELEGVEGLDLPGVPPYSHTHAWHLFVVKINSMPRGRFMEKLSQYNIGYGIHFPAAHLLSSQKNSRPKQGYLGKTEKAAERILSLPLFPDMADEDVYYVCNSIKRILREG